MRRLSPHATPPQEISEQSFVFGIKQKDRFRVTLDVERRPAGPDVAPDHGILPARRAGVQ